MGNVMEGLPQAGSVMQKIVTGLKRPSWMITSLSKIKAIFVRDRSKSMLGQKADHAQEGMNGMINKLADEPKDGFKIGIVDFNDSADIVHDLISAKALVGKVRPIVAAGSTSIGAGLEKAEELLSRTYPDDNLFTLDPVVFIWSDGEENQRDQNDVVAVADRIKSRPATLVTIACGDTADGNGLLKRLASSSQHYYRLPDVATLRQFLPQIGDTLAHSIRHGEDVGQAMGSMHG